MKSIKEPFTQTTEICMKLDPNVATQLLQDQRVGSPNSVSAKCQIIALGIPFLASEHWG